MLHKKWIKKRKDQKEEKDQIPGSDGGKITPLKWGFIKILRGCGAEEVIWFEDVETELENCNEIIIIILK